MLTDHRPFPLSRRRHDTAGVALVVTLALLVLVTVAVVAFFSRTTTNQQITSGSSQGVVATTFADGATQEIIAGLQKEMWDLSGYSQLSPAPNPAIFPIPTLPSSVSNRIQGIVPTRMVGPNVPSFPGDGTTPPDPNKPYSQFANLVKQSYTGVPTYSGTSGINSATGVAGPSVTGNAYASTIPTTAPATGGREHDGLYWNQPQLTSVSSTSATASTDLAPLVPDWIYTTRSGTHPTTYSSSLAPSANGALGSTSVVGRYAYNIYDIGGLLNANVAGYGSGVNTQPNYGSKDTMIVPGYKGSVLMADLSALNLNGNLNGSNTGTFATANSSSLPAFRYSQTWATDFPKIFASGQYAGWLQPFLPLYDPAAASGYSPPSGSAYLKNNGFTSRQDLITWVNSQLGTSTNPATWALPYLTHFSYDTDAPTFAPEAKRPRSNATLSSAGGNDSSSTNDDLINPAFTAVVDVNGYPLVKHRFPLSALSLLDNIYPGNVPADLLNPNSTLYKQIRYDFGLVWDTNYNCWDYKDAEGVSGSIKQLQTATNNGTNTVPNTRSPNFFELLKAAITAGSLGKQRGTGSFDLDSDNTLDNPRYRATTYQIVQIGANIISQTTSNFFPTPICLNGQGQAPIIYGVKDLPYFYRSRLLIATVGTFSGTVMQDKQYNPAQNSTLAAVLAQPELWNPHAPNPLAPVTSTNYPSFFRVVPRTGNTVPHTQLSINAYFGQNSGQNWAVGGTTPYTSPNQEANGQMSLGDYINMGGPDLRQLITYDNSGPTAYIKFKSVAPSTALPSALESFREPCPLAAPDFPPNINVAGFPVNPTLTATASVVFDGQPNTQIVGTSNAIPGRFAPASNTTALGFLLGYFCGGPNPKTLATFAGVKGGPMLMDLQYSTDGTNFYTYDTIQSAFPSGQTSNAPPAQSQQTEVGVRTDPRTNRWGLLWANIPGGQGIYGNMRAGQYDLQAGRTFAFTGDLTSVNYGTGGNTNNLPLAPGWLGTLITSPIQLGWTQVNQTSGAGYYQDPDGVVRRADGAYVTTGASAISNPTGLPQAMLAADGNGQAPTPVTYSTYDSRPVVLNRPFQSVAELGYVFRDTPWRSLDFFTPESGDKALLDVFSVYGPDPYSYMNTLNTETGLVAGKVNLNTRQQPVLAALLKGAATTTVIANAATPTLTTLNDSQAAAVAQALVQWTTDTADTTEGPLSNPAELVGKYTGSTGTNATGYNGFSSILTTLLPTGEAAIVKQQRECVMHALADSGTTRTWNLFIDLVAQTGQLASNAQGLQSFAVSGERHTWVSVALDRITGKVVKMQVEPVRL